MLISIKVGSIGLNLSHANVVIIMEPWWNPAVEDQAIDRINRFGQKKEMRIFKLITKNTVEEKIKEIREEKKQLIQITIEQQNRDKKSQSTLDADSVIKREWKYILNRKFN